jgi:hypothetical protein
MRYQAGEVPQTQVRVAYSFLFRSVACGDTLDYRIPPITTHHITIIVGIPQIYLITQAIADLIAVIGQDVVHVKVKNMLEQRRKRIYPSSCNDI